MSPPAMVSGKSTIIPSRTRSQSRLPWDRTQFFEMVHMVRSSIWTLYQQADDAPAVYQPMLFGQVPNMFCRCPQPVLGDVPQGRPIPFEQTIGPETTENIESEGIESEVIESEIIESEVIESGTTDPETVCYPFPFTSFPLLTCYLSETG